MPAAQRTPDAFERLVLVEVDLVIDLAEKRGVAPQQKQGVRLQSDTGLPPACHHQNDPGVPSRMRAAPVAARTLSTVVSEAISLSTRPRSVTSMTASSVTISLTTFVPVSGSVHFFRIL